MVVDPKEGERYIYRNPKGGQEWVVRVKKTPSGPLPFVDVEREDGGPMPPVDRDHLHRLPDKDDGDQVTYFWDDGDGIEEIAKDQDGPPYRVVEGPSKEGGSHYRVEFNEEELTARVVPVEPPDSPDDVVPLLGPEGFRGTRRRPV